MVADEAGSATACRSCDNEAPVLIRGLRDQIDLWSFISNPEWPAFASPSWEGAIPHLSKLAAYLYASSASRRHCTPDPDRQIHSQVDRSGAGRDRVPIRRCSNSATRRGDSLRWHFPSCRTQNIRPCLENKLRHPCCRVVTQVPPPRKVSNVNRSDETPACITPRLCFAHR